MNSLQHNISRFFGFSAVLLLLTVLSAAGLQTKTVTPAENDSKALISQKMVDQVNDMQLQKLKYFQSKTFDEYSKLNRSIKHSRAINRAPIKFTTPTLSWGWDDARPLRFHRTSAPNIIYNSGRISLHPDSLYFNFATGLNSGDSLGMDIRITLNEGCNFGDEGWGTVVVNPSLLYYLSPDSSLDLVNSVPSVSDTNYTWTSISWEANNYQPVAAGNIWVIYTRTTHHYVVMEVTASSGTDFTNAWIEFNYAYQDDGSTTFEGGGTQPTAQLDIQVNGVDDAVIIQGEPFSFTVYFSDTLREADISTWLDMDGDGVFNDTVDYDLDEYYHITDNGPEDENPADGVYQHFFDGHDDGPNRVSNIRIFFTIDDGASSDVASLFIDPIDSPYSFSGHVTPDTANIIIMAFPMGMGDEEGYDGNGPWMTVTDAAGNYQNFLPHDGMWALMAFDFLGITDGMVADTAYYNVEVLGNEIGYDFNFFQPTSGVEGTVMSEMGVPLAAIDVYIERAPFFATTDESGYYFIGLTEGYWTVDLDNMGLIPDFLVPLDTTVEVFDNDTAWVDFTAYSTDAMISGTVYLDGRPWSGGIKISAWSPLGWTEAPVGYDGYYELQVASAGDTYGGYYLGIDWKQLPPDIMVDEMPDIVLSGTNGADIYLVSVTGGIEGIISDAVTQGPVEQAWVYAYNDTDENGTGTQDGGYYYLPLPNGTYTISVGGEGYYIQTFDQVVIQDNIIQMDFTLQPFKASRLLSGYVSDMDGNPLEDVELNIGNEMYWDYTYTDLEGYYEFTLPSGFYGISASLDGFIDVYDTITINDTDAQLDFTLEQIVINSAIEGYVIDGETGYPVIGADVYAFGEFYEGYAMSTTDGYFFIEVPSDTFWVVAQAPGFGQSDPFEIVVEEQDTVEVTLELYQPMFTPQIVGVYDVPNDQGRQVHVVWQPGDTGGEMPWTQFSIWRMIPYAGAEFPMWDYVATVPFHGMELYSTVVPTLVDSNMFTGPTDEFWSVFRVTAHTYNPWEFYDSEPVAGYSIDNLKPMPPMDFTIELDPGSSGAVVLSWKQSPEEDFNYYTLYRSEDGSDFTEIGMMGDTMYVDSDISFGHEYTYELTATDFNGNTSDASVISTQALSIIEGAEIPDVYALSQNYPNPFNPSTELQYDLPEDGFVSVVIFNTLGREVDRLVYEHQRAGKYHVVWNATDQPSGLYFVRMQTESFTKTRKMMLIK